MLVLRRAVVLLRCPTARNPSAHPSHFSSSTHSWLFSLGKPLLPWPPPNRRPPQPDAAAEPRPLQPPAAMAAATPEAGESVDPSVFEKDAATIAGVLTGSFSETADLDAALDATGLEPSPPLLHAVLRASELSPTPALALFRWARTRPGFRPTPPLLAFLVDLLGKSRSFDEAWSVLLADESGQADAFVVLIRRYARAGMPQAAIRTYEYTRNSRPSPPLPPPPAHADGATDPFDLLVDALCKEGHTRAAAEYLSQRKAAEPGWSPTVRSYNILLNGWFRSRRLRKAEQVWEEMRRPESICPTVVTYGTMIEGLCRMRRVDQAMVLLEEMAASGIRPNEIACNPIVDALAEAGRFKEALGAVEKFSLYGISPNISTYNSLVKGFCKNGEMVGASKVLKTMIGRGSSHPTTYNYFFRYFAKSGKIEEGMALYNKMIQSGFAPDRLTYHLLIKLLCERKRPELAAEVIGEMRRQGLDSDLATSSMVVHLLCRMGRLEEACGEFEGMVRKGIVPQYLTCRMLVRELERAGRAEAVARVAALMGSVPHSTKLPNTYREERGGGPAAERNESILRKAQAISDALKASKEKNGRVAEVKSSSKEDAVESANKLISDIKRRVYAVCN